MHINIHEIFLFDLSPGQVPSNTPFWFLLVNNYDNLYAALPG